MYKAGGSQDSDELIGDLMPFSFNIALYTLLQHSNDQLFVTGHDDCDPYYETREVRTGLFLEGWHCMGSANMTVTNLVAVVGPALL